MTTKDIARFQKFQRRLGLILLIGLGIIPLVALFWLNIIIFHPYAAIIGVVAGGYIYNNAKSDSN